MSSKNFFSLSNSLYEFFSGRGMNIFLRLVGVHEFFSFNFPLREYIFCTSKATPPPPHKFSNGPSLIATRGERKGKIMQILKWQKRRRDWGGR